MVHVGINYCGTDSIIAIAKRCNSREITKIIVFDWLFIASFFIILRIDLKVLVQFCKTSVVRNQLSEDEMYM